MTIRHGYVVLYTEHGEAKSSDVVSRFDSLNERSAITIAREVLARGCSGVKVCEVIEAYRIEPDIEIVKIDHADDR